MRRFLIALFLFLILGLVETSFVSSWPQPWCYFPLVFVASVYLFQHDRSVIGLWWLVGYGIFLDVWSIGLLPSETTVYIIVALALFLLNRRLFTHRSLYGILGCVTVLFLILQVIHGAYFLILYFYQAPFSGGIFLNMVFFQFIFILISIFILFISGRKIKHLFDHLLVSERR